MCDHFLARGSYTLFAAHFKRLEELASLYPNCKLWHMQVIALHMQLPQCTGPRHWCLLCCRVLLLWQLMMLAADATAANATYGNSWLLPSTSPQLQMLPDRRMAMKVAFNCQHPTLL
jgi:hypothetical protein